MFFPLYLFFVNYRRAMMKFAAKSGGKLATATRGRAGAIRKGEDPNVVQFSQYQSAGDLRAAILE
ncbi:MAG: hypothetical protein EBS87_11755 [Sphingomonadaceae bacterium]|nr:hypothetical protein [Sphingomonadaceae bacterium]